VPTYTESKYVWHVTWSWVLTIDDLNLCLMQHIPYMWGPGLWDHFVDFCVNTSSNLLSYCAQMSLFLQNYCVWVSQLSHAHVLKASSSSVPSLVFFLCTISRLLPHKHLVCFFGQNKSMWFPFVPSNKFFFPIFPWPSLTDQESGDLKLTVLCSDLVPPSCERTKKNSEARFTLPLFRQACLRFVIIWMYILKNVRQPLWNGGSTSVQWKIDKFKCFNFLRSIFRSEIQIFELLIVGH
jgi:hypothetical protein